MDMAFFTRSRAAAERRDPAPADFAMFVAALQSEQRASAAARAASSRGAPQPVRLPVAEIVLGGPACSEALRSQRGSFNPALAATGVKSP
jgi:hypothetical protein